jgi:hypothetical protein
MPRIEQPLRRSGNAGIANKGIARWNILMLIAGWGNPNILAPPVVKFYPRQSLPPVETVGMFGVIVVLVFASEHGAML